MKTDAFFYKLFRLEPELLFRLLDAPMEGRYTYESVTVKDIERRLDGFFKCTDGSGPDVFLEVQGYPDPKIYWRLLRKIIMHHESSAEDGPFWGVVLFLDEAFDPGDFPLESRGPSLLIKANLLDCLHRVEGRKGGLVVLDPLVVERKEELPERIGSWKREIASLDLPEDRQREFQDLLEYIILQKFPSLTREELQNMLQLTPLEETVAGREVREMGRKDALRVMLTQRFGHLDERLTHVLDGLAAQPIEESLPLAMTSSREDLIRRFGSRQ